MATSYVQKKLLPSPTMDFPANIAGYTFSHEFEKKGHNKFFRLGIYKNKYGKQAIAKIYSTSIKDYNYFTIRNEVRMYQLLNIAKTRSRKSLPYRLRQVILPKLIKTYETDKELVMLLDYIEAQPIKHVKADKQVEMYMLIVDYLTFLYDSLSQEEKNMIELRNGASYIKLFPLLVLKSAFTHPRLIPLLPKAILLFYKDAKYLRQTTNYSIVHRDLHFRNILYNAKNVILLDLQLCVRTFPMFEYCNSLRMLWKQNDFHAVLLQKLRKKYQDNPEQLHLFRVLSIHSAIHGLTGKQFSHYKIDCWIEFLRFNLQTTLYPARNGI